MNNTEPQRPASLAAAHGSPDKMQPELKIKSLPIDLELCELLGDKPSDFIVVCFDGVQLDDLLGAVVKFIQGKLAESKRTLKCREDMQKVWSEGTDESWRAVGNRMTKARRLIESDMHGRIAAKNRKEVDMFKATLSALQQAPNDGAMPRRKTEK